MNAGSAPDGTAGARKPPLFDETPVETSRRCSRWLGDRNCNEPAVEHVIWDEAMENGFVCSDHAVELGSLWSFWKTHDIGPDCAMPGALFFVDENVCRCPDDLQAAEQAGAVDLEPIAVTVSRAGLVSCPALPLRGCFE